MPCPNCRCPSCLALVGSTIPSTKFSLPPSELTTANRAPTNSEVAYSWDIIRSSENMVALIQAMVGDLEKRKTELLDLVSKHKATISPLRSFPRSCWSRYLNNPLQWSIWRKIILDTPRLWTKVLTAHPKINSWITRSRELPLHLELDLSSSAFYQTLEALIPHSHRWQHIDFHLEPSSHSVLARVRTRLHSLKSLNLFFGDTIGIVDFCEVAPQLTQVKLMQIYEPIIIRLPWEQLRVCTLDNSEVARYVLQHAKNLRELHLDMSKLSGNDPLIEPVMLDLGPHSHHPELNILIIEWSSMDPDINLFFSSITLPSLQTLQVCFDYPDFEDSDCLDANQTKLALTLAGFFERSCAHLNTLKLTDISFSQDGLVKCLVFSPSLISLDIQFDSRWLGIGGTLLGRLNVNHPTCILPHLRSLALRHPVDILIEEPLDTLIASRRHIDPKHDGVALLEDLTLECSFFQLDKSPRFHRFASEGLNILYENGY
ncbi:hypothetical protein BD779DRAFT_1677142 [Infundibulicybe gibba]|nr:hypothetical protein BD779DRAFT_1677142 [Infundibulicybe gibba]